MATRSSFIYSKPDGAFDLPRLFTALESLGLRLENPATQEILMLTEDGEPVAVSLSEIADRIKHGVDTSFEMWYGENHTLDVRVRANQVVRAAGFGMEGTSEQERAALRTALGEYFGSLVREGSGIGFIFDPEGVTEDYDWDRFFAMGEILHPAVLSFGLPEFLVLTRSLVSRVSGFSVHLYGDGKLQLVRLLDMKNSEANFR